MRVRVSDYLNNKEEIKKKKKMYKGMNMEYECQPVNLNGALTPVDDSVSLDDIEKDIVRRFY